MNPIAPHTLRRLTLLTCLSLVTAFLTAPLAAAQTNTGDSLILTAEGKVEYSRSGETTWNSAAANQPLRVGDRMRTGLKSRATLRLSDLSTVRLNELTTLEIRPPQGTGKAGLDLKSGSTYFFNREKPLDVQFRTPLASGAIRGTEFYLGTDEKETQVAVYDGIVDLRNDQGAVELRNGELGKVTPNAAPSKSPMVNAKSWIQWVLYYPSILYVPDLELAAGNSLRQSIDLYNSGALLQAGEALGSNIGDVQSEKTYRAALLLAAGQVNEAEALLDNSSPAHALRKLISVIRGNGWTNQQTFRTATEWMAESYYQQSKGNLAGARAAAEQAVKLAPDFGSAWIRLAEMHFAHGNASASRSALEKGLQLSPQNAQGHTLQGFALAAKNDFAGASSSFDRAIAVDPGFANAWLGRGLVKIRNGQGAAGREDLQVAATMAPERSLLRSYLGKAFSHTSNSELARKELNLARRLDPADPTPWLYSALLHQNQNEINEGVRDLERSSDLNGNRGLYRSKSLLDQDAAVRSANLASLYRDAGMREWSRLEASKAVDLDYGNYSAHLFLANSYDALRDPKLVNLRYETPWFSELLVANLLAPVGAGNLSQRVSEQEYSKLFSGNSLGLFSSTEYQSSGDWVQQGSQYGTLDNLSYSLDAYYRTENGQRPNNDLEQTFYSVKLKQQITAQDSVYFNVTRSQSESGDLAQYYDQRSASRNLRLTELQEPNLFLGYHHEWSPNNHTLFLGSRIEDEFTLTDPSAEFLTLFRNGAGAISGVRPNRFNLNYKSDIEAYSAEAQQIWDRNQHTVVAGARYQTAEVSTSAKVSRDPFSFPPIYADPASAQKLESSLDRFSIYGYYYYQLLENLQLIGGVTYDYLDFPRNSEVPPLDERQSDRSQVSPKAGFNYQVLKNTTLRGAYSQSLGGVFFDSSVRLEPVQLAGFNQAFRSAIPESVVGQVPGSRFEFFGLGLDQKVTSNTYVTVSGEVLGSTGARTVGLFDFQTVPATPAGTRQELDFEERTLRVSISQLLGDNFAVGGSYRLSEATLDNRFPQIPTTVMSGSDQRNEATLHQVELYALYQVRCGFFSQVGGVWSSQSNRGYQGGMPGDEFWQLNTYVGYRFARRHAELKVGLLNITDQNYRLNPLTLYTELPRERTLVASFKFYF